MKTTHLDLLGLQVVDVVPPLFIYHCKIKPFSKFLEGRQHCSTPTLWNTIVEDSLAVTQGFQCLLTLKVCGQDGPDVAVTIWGEVRSFFLLGECCSRMRHSRL